MTDTRKSAPGSAGLRTKAEAMVDSRQTASDISSEEHDAKRLLHELQVYQIELEMQNEELHLANQTLLEHELHMQNVIKMTPAGYFHLDTNDRFVDVNDAWLKMHGYDTREDIIGKHFSLLQVDSASDSALKHLAELHRGIPIPLGEFTSRRKDGSLGHHIFSAHPVIHAERIVGSEWFLIDISESKRLEEESLLFQKQFQQAQKLESLGVLAGGIAHDFNNILTIIISCCSLAQVRPDMVGELLPEIDKAAQRAADLCRQMLTYAGKSLMTMKQIKMVELVEDMIRMLKATINQNVTITSDLASAELPSIQGDASQLRQIVMNLIINAAEAIGEGRGEIRIILAETIVGAEDSEKDHLGRIIPAGQYVCLEVTDNGCGMDDETKQRVFEPFYTTKFTGRGLGMSAVLGIITAHKGALQLFSHTEKGTSFKVYLPVQSSDSAEGNLLQHVSLMQWQGSGMVLLVEDEPQISVVAKSLIKALGFSIIEAANGTEALKLYQENAEQITMVITDIGMPIMDGYELFNKLKERDPELPIIISSGFGDTIVSSRIAAGTAAGFLNKPYSLDQLREMLKRVAEGVKPGLHSI